MIVELRQRLGLHPGQGDPRAALIDGLEQELEMRRIRCENADWFAAGECPFLLVRSSG